MLEAWTPYEQPVTKPILQVPLLQSPSARICLAGDSCHFSCNEVHQLDPYALCIQASTRGRGILEEEIPCLQRAASVQRNEPAWLYNAASTEAGTPHLDPLRPLREGRPQLQEQKRGQAAKVMIAHLLVGSLR